MTTPSNPAEYRALVVDDDPVVRHMVTYALQQEEFACSTAIDGDDALTLLKNESYDLIVTDLKMPKRNGHALTVDVLEFPNHPKIVVHTSIDDPRLTKDLMLRGVDDVFYKPANYAAFAAKARGLVVRERRIQQELRASAASVSTKADVELEQTGNDETNDPPEISLSEMKSRLSDYSKVVDVSNAAIEVSEMISSDAFDADQIAAVVQRDDALAARVLRIANTPFYNTTGKPLTNIKQAVTRIGQKRIGEFALATSTLSSITPESLPWMDLDLTWRRGIAAGVAIELLMSQGKHHEMSEGLVFSALMHNAGRVVLGMHYPKRYEWMVENCAKNETSLLHQEQLTFPECQSESICRLLSEWDIPTSMFEPLRHILKTYSAISDLPEPIRTRVELIKLAIAIGDIAVGKWQSWDSIEFPGKQVLERLNIRSVGAVLERTREQLTGILGFHTHLGGKFGSGLSVLSPTRPIAYVNLSEEPFDFLAQVLPAMGMKLREVELENRKLRGHVLINRIGVIPKKSISHHFADVDKVVFFRDADKMKYAGKLGTNVAVPCCFATLHRACRDACV